MWYGIQLESATCIHERSTFVAIYILSIYACLLSETFHYYCRCCYLLVCFKFSFFILSRNFFFHHHRSTFHIAIVYSIQKKKHHHVSVSVSIEAALALRVHIVRDIFFFFGVLGGGFFLGGEGERVEICRDIHIHSHTHT